jgi:hypothetical protein
MKKIETVFYHIVGLMLIYLVLALFRYVISFLLRYWVLLIVLVAAVYAAFRHCRFGDSPWWLVKIKAFILRVRRQGGKQ